MRQPLVYRALNSLPLAGFWRAARQFDASLHNPEAVQSELLLRLLRQNQSCGYGVQHRFATIRSVGEYQERVPIVSYDDISGWVERMKAGEGGVLTSEPLLMFEKSSGSVSAAKYVPYTRTLRAQFHAALGAWITDLYHSFPGLACGCAYWLVTPLSREQERTQGGTPVGFESDAEYFGPLHRWLLEKTLAVPAELASVPGFDNCVYLTLRFLLQARSLTFISVWNPSFLQILLKQLELHGERLVRDLLADKVGVGRALPPRITNLLKRDASQAGNLRAMLGRGRIEAEVLWPRLELISCWTSAASAAVKSEIQRGFPGVAIQGKGLLATEGVVSIPIERYKGCVAAVTSHFLEFLDLESGGCHLLSELERGAEYSVVLTTGGGFWRYQLGDRVRVTGFAERTPVLEFIGKDDCVSDLRGEKLNALFVAQVLEEFECCRSAAFAMVAPCDRGIPGYILFLESGHCETELASRLDEKMRANPHYAYCRRLGQLAVPRVFMIQQGAREAYLKHCEALGQRAGSVKMTALDKHSGWEEVFCGSYVDSDTAEVCA
ncbi:MAG TPA: GH3 auxin-responsive promoter family protein [Candidatus Sulfotelmatobacter sp.]|nr:GH3 auxin-responsive promoter family protein [Candidatus Sulfotelmatobacter sp.]